MAKPSTAVASSRRSGRNTGRSTLWHNVSEKVVVAVATAVVTGALALAGPPLNDWLFSKLNKTNGLNQEETEFQKMGWLRNPLCAASPQPLWHETAGGQKIDATICPGTGDILLVMKDLTGKQVQWWSDNRTLTNRFSGEAKIASLLSSIVATPARAAPASKKESADPQFAQNVLCQMMLPDRRGLRRRLVVGPNQCIEILIDTWTGAVVSQRPIPCTPNCAVNV